MASSQLMLSPRATWGRSSVSSMAYQAPLPPRACSKAWAHHLWVHNETQLHNCRVAVRFGVVPDQGVVARRVLACGFRLDQSSWLQMPLSWYWKQPDYRDLAKQASGSRNRRGLT